MTINLISHLGTSSDQMQMYPIMTYFHKRRFEWAVEAKKEFISNTNLMHHDVQREFVDEWDFNSLTSYFKEAEKASNLELGHHVARREKLEKLIEKQTNIFQREWEEAEQQYNRIYGEIQIYDDFSKQLVFKDINLEMIEQLVSITYTNSTRKASVINDQTAQLQEFILTELEFELWKIKQDAGILNISLGMALELPYISSIPKIIQKIDTFWLKSSYEKALHETRENASDWVKNMYLNYNILVTSVLNIVIKQKRQLEKRLEECKFENEEKRKSHENLLAAYQKEKAELDEVYQEVYQMWNQYRELATQLQSYFIKHWLKYKAELKKYLLYGNAEERWLASHYLQLLLQDGKNIIES